MDKSNKTNSSNNEDLIYIKDSSPHKYFSILPNILSYLELSPIDRSVYWAIKECAGEKGSCTKKLENIAKMAGIKKTALKESLKRLSALNPIINKSLIINKNRITQVGDKDTNEITIVDIWDENYLFFINRGGGSPNDSPRSPNDPGVGRQTTDGGSPNDHKQEPTKKNSSNKTTTPTPSKGKSLVVVPSEEDKATAKRIRAFIDSKGSELGDEWKLDIKILESLSATHGHTYFDEQFRYMWQKQKEYIANLRKMHPDSNCKPISKPRVYLKKSCIGNWAESNNLKENL